MELNKVNHGYVGSTFEVHRHTESTPVTERRWKSRRKCVAIFAVIIAVLFAITVVLAWFYFIHRVNGSYSSWSKYGPCSKTCGGGGTRNRTRVCNDPSPKNGGETCSGPSTEIGVCGETPCPVNGSYSSWSQYGPCSKSCGGGTRNRTRECNNPSPKYGGAACIGPATETGVCGNTICPGSSGITMTQQLVQDIILNYQTTQNNSTQKSTGRFQKAVFSMQREVANENAFEYFEPATSRSKRSLDSSGPLYTSYTRRRTPTEKLEDMQKFIEIAVNGTDTGFARSIFAKSLFVYIKKVMEEGMPTSEINRGAQGYLKLIEIAIGKYNFAKLMSQNGAATLMFAIDTTGSMSDEINAAKAIATSIVNRDREFPVDYILSPFNDPGTGPLTYKSESERQEFVSSISNLIAYGGGDCPELAFKGMIDAFQFQPKIGSPMFVFTDASAKDRTSSKIEELKSLANNAYATINFFVKNSCFSGTDPGFLDVASYTSGQIFPLQTDSEIEKFKDYVEDSLKDSVIIEEGKGGSSIYLILDGEVTLLLISLELNLVNQAQNVRLVDPFGQHFLPIISTTYSCIFKERYPIPGKWQLKCPPGVEAKAYSAKSAGNNTIDFTPYFLHSENKTSPVLSVETPVKGKNTTTMLQVAGTDLLDPNSMSIDVVNETGSIIRNDVKIEPMENAKSIFRCTMETPTSRFRIRLKGQMKNGHNFTRLSQVSFKESSIVLLTIRAGYEYTATVGNITAPVYVYFYSNAETDLYNVTASSTYGSMQSNPSSVRLMKGSNTTLSLQHHLPSNAQQLVGKVVTIKVGVRGSISLEQKEHQIKMMYVR